MDNSAQAIESSPLPATLPLGISDFELLREKNFLYVDKTDRIARLARLRTPFFLSRPRRFGKTLLLSTLESLFRHGLTAFARLEIEKLWTEKETYKVIRLDFSRLMHCESVTHFRALFHYELGMGFRLEGLPFPDKDSDPLTAFEAALLLLKAPPVLLIDEVDSPLTSLLAQPILYEEIRRELSHFFKIVNARQQSFRFVFLTGITRAGHAGLFSSFTTLRNISLDNDVGTLLGYTEEEIRTQFAFHLQKAGRTLSLSQEEILDALRTNYGGYAFDNRRENCVFSPWSVLSFLVSPHRRFKNYWFETGGLTINDFAALSYNPTAWLDEIAKDQTIDLSALNDATDIRKLPLPVLLTETGYLTIKAIDQDRGTVTVGIPNEEIRHSMARLKAV